MPHYSDIADLTSLVGFHGLLLLEGALSAGVTTEKPRSGVRLLVERRMLSQRECERPVTEHTVIGDVWTPGRREVVS
jgi:hypothetical protein